MMSDHDCIQGEALGRIEANINILIGTTAAHTKVIADLVSFQTLHEGYDRAKKDNENKELITKNIEMQKHRDRIRNRLTTISLLIAFFVLLSGLFFGFRKVNSDMKTVIKEEILKSK